MSALAHWFEQLGFNTVVIGLIYPHLEKIRPARSLWVPFELGRPLGTPLDTASQQSVLLQALHCVESNRKHSITEYPGEDRRSSPDPGWQCPEPLDTRHVHDTEQRVFDEYIHFDSPAKHTRERLGRTSVGVSGVTLQHAAELVSHVLGGQSVRSIRADLSAGLMFRYAVDDLKSHYIEAALATGKPSSRQIHDWFWLNTELGKGLRELRIRWMQSDDPKLSTLGERFLVPHRWRI